MTDLHDLMTDESLVHELDRFRQDTHKAIAETFGRDDDRLVEFDDEYDREVA